MQSALLSWTDKLLFSTPSSIDKRQNLIIMSSNDGAKIWRTVYKVHDGFSAYSDMVRLNKKTLGIIYETDDYENIRFKRIEMEQKL